MSLGDIASNLVPQLMSAIIANSNGDHLSSEIKINHYDDGVMFFALIVSYDDGAHVVKLEDSPDLSTWTEVPDEKLIKPDGDIILDSGTPARALMPRFGAFSTDKYMRMKITSSGIVGSGLVMYALAIKKPELKPEAI